MKAKTLLSALFLMGLNFTIAQNVVVQNNLESLSQLQSQALTCGDHVNAGAQGGVPGLAFAASDLRASNTGKTIQLANVKGSPYLAEAFEKSTIYSNNELVGTYYTRYNAYSQEIELKKTALEEEEFQSLVKNEKIRIVFVDKEIRYTTFIDNKVKRQGDYLISMTDGEKYTLHKRLKVKFVEGKEAANSMVNPIPNRFTNSTEYYLEDTNTNLVSYIPSKKSKLIALFKDSDKIQIASLIKKNGFNIKQGEDLVKIFDFANTLNENYASQGK